MGNIGFSRNYWAVKVLDFRVHFRMYVHICNASTNEINQVMKCVAATGRRSSYWYASQGNLKQKHHIQQPYFDI